MAVASGDEDRGGWSDRSAALKSAESPHPSSADYHLEHHSNPSHPPHRLSVSVSEAAQPQQSPSWVTFLPSRSTLLAILLIFTVLVGYRNILAIATFVAIYFTSLLLAIAAFNVGLPYWIQRHKSPDPSTYPKKKSHRMRFSTPAAYSACLVKKTWETRSEWRNERLHPKLEPKSVSVLDRLLMKIMRDFVWQWFDELVPPPYGTSLSQTSTHSPFDTYSSPSFPLAVEKVIRHCLRVIFLRIEQIDIPSLIIHKILPILTTHIEAFRQAESDLRGGDSSGHSSRGASSRRESRGGIYGAFFSSGNDEIDLLLARLHAEVLRKKNVPAQQNPNPNGDSDGPRPTIRLHPAVDVPTPNSQASEQAHLRRLLEKILPIVLPMAEANSRAVKLLVIELLTCSILGPVIDMLSDSDFWNRLIEERAGNVIREQKMVEQLREVLDRQLSLGSMDSLLNPASQMPDLSDKSKDGLDNQPSCPKVKTFGTPDSLKELETPGSNPTKDLESKSGDPISVKSSAKDFERFSRSIQKCNTLFDARRLKNDIETQIRKTEALLSGSIDFGISRGSERGGSTIPAISTDIGLSQTQARDLTNFLERLQAVKEAADLRIIELGGISGPALAQKSTDAWSSSLNASSQLPHPSQNAGISQAGRKPNNILQAILRDRESAALSYFTEFMDRRQRVHMVQFWLAVDGLKDPLEEGLVFDDTLSAKFHVKGHTPNVASFSSNTSPLGHDPQPNNRDLEAMRDDLKAIVEVYFGSTAATSSLGLQDEDVRPLLQFLSIDSRSRMSEEVLQRSGDEQTKPTSSLVTVKEAKGRLFIMQQKVFDRMLNEDFSAFAAAGDLYLRATASVIHRPPRPDPGSSNVSLSDDIPYATSAGQKSRPILSPGLSMSPIKSRSPPTRFGRLKDRHPDLPAENDFGFESRVRPQFSGGNVTRNRPHLNRSNSDEQVIRPSNPLKLLSQYQSFRSSDVDVPSTSGLSISRRVETHNPVSPGWHPNDRPRIMGGVVSSVLPPQVTLQAAFDERLPSERLTGTTQSSQRTNHRHGMWPIQPKADTEPNRLSSDTLSSIASHYPTHHVLPSSLDFLMSPTEEDRAPLFGEDAESHQQIRSRFTSSSRLNDNTQNKRGQAPDPDGHKHQDDLPGATKSKFFQPTQPSMNFAASIALQEALSSIISTADVEGGPDVSRVPVASTSPIMPLDAPYHHAPVRSMSTPIKSHADDYQYGKTEPEDAMNSLPSGRKSTDPVRASMSMGQPNIKNEELPAQRKGLFDDDNDDDEHDWDSDDWDTRDVSYPTLYTQSKATSDSVGVIHGGEFQSALHRGHLASRERPQSSFIITGASEADKRISQLENQLNLLSSLMRKAELTGNKLEIRLVHKSIDSVSRELSEVIYQKTRLIEQKENALGGFRAKLVPGRVRVSITGTTTGRLPSAGHSSARSVTSHSSLNLASAATGLVTGSSQDVVLYSIEVHKLTEEDGSFGSGWIVTRRYNEFNTLHKALKNRYVIARQLEFPAKIIGIGIGISIGSTNSRALVEQRKLALERFLRSLIQIPVLCESPELAGFLSRSKANLRLGLGDPTTSLQRQMELFAGSGFVKSIYKSITSGSGILNLEEGASKRRELPTSPPTMFESMMGGLRQQALEFAYGFTAGSPAGMPAQDNLGLASSSVNQVIRANASSQVLEESSARSHEENYEGDTLAALTTNVRPIEGELLTSFTAPICDLLIEIFELNDKNRWLRKQGIVIVLQQILGGTIERKVREAMSESFDDEHLAQLIGLLETALWDSDNEGGKLKPPPEIRTFEQKIVTRDGAYRKLSAIIPDLAASVLGRSNARRGVRRLFSMCQNRRLNKHLLYTIIDEVLRSLFPEAGI